MAGFAQQVDSPVGACLWVLLPSLVLPSVVHWVKSMAGFAQQIDSPVGAAAGAAAAGVVAAAGGALGQEHGRVCPAG